MTVTSDSGNVTWEPWTDGFAVGFVVTNKVTGTRRYLYLNPSTGDAAGGGGDTGTTFIYWDNEGVPADGMTISYIDVLEDPT